VSGVRWADAEIDALKAAYENARLAQDIDLSGLAVKLGRHKTNISRKARSLGLTLKSRKRVEAWKVYRKHETPEARKAAIVAGTKRYQAEHGHPRGALGMRHSAETKAVLGQKGREWWASRTQTEKDDFVYSRVRRRREQGVPFANPRGSWKAGWREIGDRRVFFRSRWEANYGRYLEWLRGLGQIADWEHEAETFWFDGIKRGCVSYLPDFKVTNLGGTVEWHEVKGWMDARSKTVIRRMAKYHPTVKLVVVEEKGYREIARKVGSLIPGWET
jgi:hypothetical protein